MISKLKFTSFKGNRKNQKMPIYIPNHCVNISVASPIVEEPVVEPELVEPELVEPIIELAQEVETVVEEISQLCEESAELAMLNGIINNNELSTETKDRLVEAVNWNNRFKLVKQKSKYKYIQ